MNTEQLLAALYKKMETAQKRAYDLTHDEGFRNYAAGVAYGISIAIELMKGEK